MEFVIPLRIPPVPSARSRLDHPNIVEIAFRDQPRLTSQQRRLLVESVGELCQKVRGAEIVNAVNRIQPQRVDVIFGQPVQSVVDEKLPDAVADRKSTRL